MSETISFDAFKFCWDEIFQESATCGMKFFSSENCKILDSRDNNFNIVETRLAYLYKYGYFNILFFEKCFLLFINQCSDATFPFDNLKLCSLSNGPGFDIIGLLSALRNSNKPLRCLPVFNSINVHGSWSGLYETLVCKAYKACITKSFTEYFHLNPMNINLIQGDIYSTLSSESKYCLSNSNVLLMVNVFKSSKASPMTFENSLKEIFTLLQPESLIFFIGSKNNLKLFSKLNNLKQYVKCICGPQEVALNDLPINEQISNSIGAKPCNSGHAKFVVWQKKFSTGDEQESIGENVVDVECDNSDTLSELSISSIVENCDALNSRLPDSNTEKIKPQLSISKPQNFTANSVENVTSLLSDVKLSHENSKEQKFNFGQHNSLQTDCSNTFNQIIESPKLVNYSFLQNNVSVVKDSSKVPKKTVKKDSVSLANAEADTASNVITDKIYTVKQILTSKPIMDQDTSKKKRGSSNKTENQSLNGNSPKHSSDHPKTLQKKISLNVSCENSLKKENLSTFPTTNTENLKYTNSDVQSLLQRCDSLISKLEELTVDIKSELNSPRREDFFNKTQFSVKQTENCPALHHGCCVRIVHSCCCRKFCKH